ncbi:MAG: dTDP-4-dehydrorhamnose 3,5-epimerase [Gemmatimonadota bacterium]
MIVTPASLPEVLLLQPRIHRDERGHFLETWSATRYSDVGITDRFVQDNVSVSQLGVIRGLHFQHPQPQGKLVSCLLGTVFDVAVDVRWGSPTFGGWVGFELSDDNGHQLWVPPGFAHGFQALSPEVVFAYKCTAPYAPSAERSIRWDDPDIGIAWPRREPIVSAKDQSALSLASHPTEALPRFKAPDAPR